MVRYITRQIVATKNHCSPNCPGARSQSWCKYFEGELKIGTPKSGFAPVRLKACKDYEIPLRGKDK